MEPTTTISHLYAENKRLNELVVHLLSECHERVSYARHAEVDLHHQVLALKDQLDVLRLENEHLKLSPSSPSPSSPPPPSPSPPSPPPSSSSSPSPPPVSSSPSTLPAIANYEQINNNQNQKMAREHLLAKLHDLHAVLDGLSSHGSHLHKMVYTFYKSNTNTITTNQSSTSVPNTTSPASTSNPAPPIISPASSASPVSMSNASSLLSDPPSIFISPSVPSIALPSTPLSESHGKRDERDALVEFNRLSSLLSPLWGDFGSDLVYCGSSSKTLEEELTILEQMFERSFYMKSAPVALTLSPSPSSSTIPHPPPPPPILNSPPPPPPPKTPSALQKQPKRPVVEKRVEKKNEEVREGLLAAIMAVRPDSEARLQSMEKFEKERIEHKEDDIDREVKGTPMSLMDRLMRALKRVKVDSSVRMAAIAEVEQAVQTRSSTVRSDRLITDTMISQQKVMLKRASGGIEALEEARMKKLEALRAQYREESLSLQHSSFEGEDIYQYGSSDEAYSDEEEDAEGGLASIMQGLIRTPRSRDVHFAEADSQDDQYYSEDDEDDTLFESLGQLVHERFAARSNFTITEIP